MGTALLVLQGVLMVVGGSVVLLKVVSPMTDTKVDDKMLGVFSKIEALLKKLSLTK